MPDARMKNLNPEKFIPTPKLREIVMGDIPKIHKGNKIYFEGVDEHGAPVWLEKEVVKIIADRGEKKFVLNDAQASPITYSATGLIANRVHIHVDPTVLEIKAQQRKAKFNVDTASKTQIPRESKRLIDNQVILENLTATELTEIKKNTKNVAHSGVLEYWAGQKDLLKNNPLEYFTKKKEYLESKLDRANNKTRIEEQETIRQLQRAIIVLEEQADKKPKIVAAERKIVDPVEKKEALRDRVLHKIEEKKENIFNTLSGIRKELAIKSNALLNRLGKNSRIAVLLGAGIVAAGTVTKYALEKPAPFEIEEGMLEPIKKVGKFTLRERNTNKAQAQEAELQKNQKTIAEARKTAELVERVASEYGPKVAEKTLSPETGKARTLKKHEVKDRAQVLKTMQPSESYSQIVETTPGTPNMPTEDAPMIAGPLAPEPQTATLLPGAKTPEELKEQIILDLRPKNENPFHSTLEDLVQSGKISKRDFELLSGKERLNPWTDLSKFSAKKMIDNMSDPETLNTAFSYEAALLRLYKVFSGLEPDEPKKKNWFGITRPETDLEFKLRARKSLDEKTLKFLDEFMAK